MSDQLVNHPEVNDFWRHEPPKPSPCWVCGEETEWVYLDIDYQHPDCERYPTRSGEVLIVRGVRTEIPREEMATEEDKA